MKEVHYLKVMGNRYFPLDEEGLYMDKVIYAFSPEEALEKLENEGFKIAEIVSILRRPSIKKERTNN